MEPDARAKLWAGRSLSLAFASFLLIASAAPKLVGARVATDAIDGLGWPRGLTPVIGLIELICVILYLVPGTAVLGAILTMALLGGAIATQLRVGAPMFSHVLFGVYLGVVMWAGLWLRDPQLRAILPWRRAPGQAA